MSHKFEYGAPWVNVEIISAPPKWTTYDIEPAVQRIIIYGIIKKVQEQVAPINPIQVCTKSTTKQLRHWRMKTFAYKHKKFESNYNLKLFAENNIQKIYVKDRRILTEVEFETYMQYPDLFIQTLCTAI